MSSNIQITKTCICCGNEFTARTLHTRYCSHACNRKHYKQMKRDEKLKQNQHGSVNAVQSNGSKQQVDTSVQDKQFLSIDEAATLIGASSRTILRLIAKGVLKIGKVGRRSIIQRKEIDKLFQ